MKILMIAMALTSVALKAEAQTSLTLPRAPSTLQSIRQIVVPAPQSSLLDDTDKENDLRFSLASDKALESLVSIESITCDDGRCQLLVEPIAEESQVVGAITSHVKKFPELGSTVLVTNSRDKENKKLLNLILSTSAAVSTAH